MNLETRPTNINRREVLGTGESEANHFEFTHTIARMSVILLTVACEYSRGGESACIYSQPLGPAESFAHCSERPGCGRGRTAAKPFTTDQAQRSSY